MAAGLSLLPIDQIVKPDDPGMAEALKHFSPDALRTLMIVMSVIVAMAGVAMLALGFMVRRQSHAVWAILLSILLGCAGGYTLLNCLAALSGAFGQPQMLAAALLMAVLAAAFLAGTTWSIQAARSGPEPSTAPPQPLPLDPNQPLIPRPMDGYYLTLPPPPP
ncbi:MAG TPA: DUF3040 domain-containing protein [Tepidisphaeraceae bacterium]